MSTTNLHFNLTVESIKQEERKLTILKSELEHERVLLKAEIDRISRLKAEAEAEKAEAAQKLKELNQKH